MSKDDKKKQTVVALDPVAIREMQKQEEEMVNKEPSALEQISKAIKNYSAQRMAFEVDVDQNKSTGYAGLYYAKQNLIPDAILKRIIGPQGDDLVMAVIQARSNIMSSFGRPRVNRFQVGFEMEPLPGIDVPKDGPDFDKLQTKLQRMKQILWNCGISDIDEDQPMTLSQFLKQLVRNGVGYGRFAVEFIYAIDPKEGKEYVHSFRPVDATTIHKVLPKEEQNQSIRSRAIKLLQELKNEKIDAERFVREEYKWVQVINNQPRQMFTANELVVHSLYPVTDVDYNGYPLTPIDQCINAVVTHINITLHNKLYFQHGRAAKGMLVFQSDDIDEGLVQRVRLQFHQSINQVQNSWRMPVFGIGKDDSLQWQAIDTSGRDQEFQYLSDNNARVILSAFQMSPEELPGYAHLARGTNTQSLAEADNEWKLTAARDVGLRPLMYELQDFFNTHILPRFDKELAKTHQIVFAGLERDSPEKEATRLSTDMGLHMTYNEALEAVEKSKLPRELGGDVPMNPQFQSNVLNPFLSVGQIMESFFAIKGAASDPRFQYYRDPFWMQYQQIMLNKAQIQMQNQMQQMQMQQQAAAAQNGETPPEEGDGGEGGDEGGDQPPQFGKSEEAQAANYMLLEKNIGERHKSISKMILKQHKHIVDAQMSKWEENSKKALEKIKAELKKDEK
jgi:hypothetical protein